MALDDVPSLLPPPPARKKRTGVLDALEQFVYGAGQGLTNNLEGLYPLATDPYAGTQILEGLSEMVANPRQAAQGLL